MVSFSCPALANPGLPTRYELWGSRSDVPDGPSYRPGRTQRHWVQERPLATGQGSATRGSPASERRVDSLKWLEGVGRPVAPKIGVRREFERALEADLGGDHAFRLFNKVYIDGFETIHAMVWI